MVSVVSQPTTQAVHAQPKLESRPFELVSEFQPAGDQPEAIAELIAGIENDERDQAPLNRNGPLA